MGGQAELARCTTDIPHLLGLLDIRDSPRGAGKPQSTVHLRCYVTNGNVHSVYFICWVKYRVCEKFPVHLLEVAYRLEYVTVTVQDLLLILVLGIIIQA